MSLRLVAIISALGCFVKCTAFSPTAMGASAELLFKLTAPEPQIGAWFGETLATADGDILVGEPLYSTANAALVGQAYLYDGLTGQLIRTFINPDPMREGRFGQTVASGDGWVLIGGGTPNGENRIYVYDKHSGALLRRIENPANDYENFGSAIAYGDGALIVSSPAFSFPGIAFPVGRAHLFQVATGELLRTLPNPEPNSADVWGNSVAVFGDKIAVGAILDDLPDDHRPGGNDPGRVWILDRHTGAVRFTLENPNPEPGSLDWFGEPVAANHEFIVVGAPEDETSGSSGSGTAYVFDADTGELLHTLLSPQNEVQGEFGGAVAITPAGDILVGAWATSVDGIERAGRAYLFDGDTGNLLVDIPNPDPSFSADFGWSVAALDNRIIVGARDATVNGLPSAGTVYVYAIIPEPSTLVLTSAFLASFIVLWRQQVCNRAF